MHCQQRQPLHINSKCTFLKGVLGRQIISNKYYIEWKQSFNI